MIELTIRPGRTAIEISDTTDFRSFKYLHLTAEEQALVRSWVARAEALMTEKGGVPHDRR